uniref:Uncharacterized protein n=1 Tax=Rhizophagus irregularis (strain DAOM 181602 / DAOM 197198 / MUCL 43194) TaxID=747089 RepID=U9UHX3_RHIID
MKICWDSNPYNRPSVIEIEELLRLFILYENEEIKKQFDEAENIEIIDQRYTS